MHKPWIDQVTWPCAGCGGTMRRVPEVIDCWFDSGCMPFAQWGYPHQGRSEFEQSFPADFISEAIDQTRGWFYSLLMDLDAASSTGAAQLPAPRTRRASCSGTSATRRARRRRKSKGNYTPPEIILDRVRMEFAVVRRRGRRRRGRDRRRRSSRARTSRGSTSRRAARRCASIAATRRSGASTLELRRARSCRGAWSCCTPDDRGDARRRAATHGADVKPRRGAAAAAARAASCGRGPATPAPGADAFRWFFYASSPPWSTTRHSLSNVRALQKEFPRQAAQRLLVLHHLREHRRLRSRARGRADARRARPSSTAGSSSELALDDARRDERHGRLRRLRRDAAPRRRSSTRSRTGTCAAAASASGRAGWDDDKRERVRDALRRASSTLAKLLGAVHARTRAEAMYQNLVVRPGAAGAAGERAPRGLAGGRRGADRRGALAQDARGARRS